MTRIALIAAAAGALLSIPAVARAEFDQTAAQQACGNDVFAMCQQAIPDQNRIAACLRQNFRQVSHPCQQFMASYASHVGKTARAAHSRPVRETTGAGMSE
jgi:hypothetical protein